MLYIVDIILYYNSMVVIIQMVSQVLNKYFGGWMGWGGRESYVVTAETYDCTWGWSRNMRL